MFNIPVDMHGNKMFGEPAFDENQELLLKLVINLPIMQR